MGPRDPKIRNDGIHNWDLSIFKNFRATEKISVQFRAEALNALSTPRFSGPNTSVTSSSFGVITSQANAPRQVQFGLKILLTVSLHRTRLAVRSRPRQPFLG